jgi:hypothetical protein
LEIQKKYENCKRLEEKNQKKKKTKTKQNKTECPEIEPNLLKDRTMHEGDNPSF